MPKRVIISKPYESDTDIPTGFHPTYRHMLTYRFVDYVEYIP